MRTISLALVSLAAVSAACGGARPSADATSDSVVTTAAAPAQPPAATTGFNVPESVRYDAELDVYFVSSINGNPSAKDNNGSISRVDAANPATVSVLVQGGQNGAQLHAPKGVALVGDTLWVTDIDAVRGFDRRSGAAVATIDLAGRSNFLNDIVAGPDGTLYITDTGVRFDATGNMTHPGPDRVFAIRGRDVTVAIEGDQLARPNGITWDAANQRFLIAPFGGPAILGWKPGEQTVTQVATGPGTYDGIEVLADGRFVVSSWADSSLHVGSGSTMTRVAGGMEAPADIGVDTKRGLVAVPRFNAGRVEYVAVPR